MIQNQATEPSPAAVNNTGYYVMLAGGGIMLTALALFGCLQYRFPNATAYLWGFNPMGANQFESALFHHGRSPMAVQPFLHRFRLLLVLVYASYAMMVIASGRSRTITFKPVLGLIIAASAAMALLFPPTLAMDSYFYLAYGHLGVLHGLNPYVIPPAMLLRFGDPLTRQMNLMPVAQSVYGPLWIFICYLIVAVFHGLSLWWQAAAIKLVAACAVVGAALAGRRIAGHFEKGSGNRTLLAIGLNPLLLVEGPGIGHNDVFMVCALLMAIALYVQKRHAAAALLFGVSIAVKMLPLLLLPWLMLDLARGGRGADEQTAPRITPRALASACLFALTACLPLIVLMIPFWHGTATLSGFNGYTNVDLTAAEREPVRAWLISHHLGTHLTPLLVSLSRLWPIATIDLLILLWLMERADPKKWLIGWVSITCLWPLMANNLWFPWYFCWSWPVSLVRWNRTHALFSVLCGVLALLWSLLYTQPLIPMPLAAEIQSVLRALF